MKSSPAAGSRAGSGPTSLSPVRMHVDAKRYLCAVEPAYQQQLSPPSLVSLALQGGPMTSDEVEAFRESPHADGGRRPQALG